MVTMAMSWECGTLDAHVATEELAETVPHRRTGWGWRGTGIRKDAINVARRRGNVFLGGGGEETEVFL